MKTLRRMVSRLRGALLGRKRDRDLAEELESHILMQTEDNLRAGMAPETARREAVLKFGGLESVKESYREQRGLPLLESVVSDLRFALRGLRKNPGFTLTAVAALAVGIGATTAVFSIVNTVLLKPIHVFEPDRLLMLMADHGSEGDDYNPVASPAEFAYWRTQSSVFEDMWAGSDGVMNYAGGDVVEQWQSFRVSADIFRCMGIRVLQGRTFSPEEDLPNGPRVAVIGEGLWMQRFGGDPSILGKPVILNGEPYAVIGVVEDSESLRIFASDQFTQVYVPFQLDPNTHDIGQFFYTLARLKPGVTLGQARERLRASTDEFRTKFPNSLGPKNFFKAAPLQEALVSGYRPLFAILLSAVGLVLLIACANVANLLLARAAGRGREIAIRAAIGAGRRRMIRQLMTESLLLSLAAGALGSFLGFRGIRALLAVNAADLPMVGAKGTGVNMDWQVMFFALAVSVATAMVFGLLPALQASRADLNTLLKNSGPQSGGGIRRNKARAALVVSEISLAVILLVGSALLIRSFVWIYRADRGFDTKNVLTVNTLFSDPKYRKAAVVGEAVHSGLDHIRSLPGVVTVGSTGCMPLQCTVSYNFDIFGRPPAKPLDQGARWATVSPDFFETLRIPIKRGRPFSFRDNDTSAPVAIINEAMANKYWKDSDPLQDQIVIGKGIGKDLDDPIRQIIGIVGNVRDEASNIKNPRPIMYVPVAQVPVDENLWLNTQVTWVIRTQTQPNGLVPAVREELRRATGLPIGEVHSLNELVSLSISEQQLSMLLMTVFGCSALLLASIGIYGVMAYTVQQRTQEIGIRMALGAPAGQVRNMVVRQGIGLTAVGVVIGMGAAWAVARSMESLLFGVRAHDPIVFVAVPLILSIVALLAVWVPATRASRVNLVDSLRCE